MADLQLNLGIDFGTSFTKVCVRETGKGTSWIINFSKSKADLNEALLPTKIVITKDGSLLAGLTQSEWSEYNDQIEIDIDFIKMRLAHLDLSKEGQQYSFDDLPKYQEINLNNEEILENLCAFYLSQVILKSQEWVLTNNTKLIKNKKIDWSFNVGVPVKYCDSQSIFRFTKVLHLAWLLLEKQPQTFKELFSQMKKCRQKLDQLVKENNEKNIPIPCFAIPEIAAAIYSYTVSRQAEDGIKIFFDIGSGTMEGVSFRFWRQDGSPKVEFYSGEVEPIGVNGLAKKIGKLSNFSEKKLVQQLESNNSLLSKIYEYSETIARPARQGEFIANKTFISSGHFRLTVEAVQERLKQTNDLQEKQLLYLILGQHLIHQAVGEVVLTCKEKNSDHFKNTSSLTVFLGGGGKDSIYYQDTIESTHTAFCQENASIPIYNIKQVPFPGGGLTEVEDFNMSGINNKHFHRFAIAYGLSIPEYEAPKVEGFPSQFERKGKQKPQPIIPEWGKYPDDHSSM